MTANGTELPGRVPGAIAAGVRLGRMAVVADLLLAGFLTALLLVLTSSDLDAIPRPFALLLLYATPGIVGAMGVIGRRRSLLYAAGVALAPGSVLSFTGVTLIFVLPLALFWAAAVTMGPPGPRPARIVELAELSVLAGLIVGAGVALITLTEAGCNASGSHCSSAVLTGRGAAVEVGLLLAAVGFAAWRAFGARRSA